jgi:hypothetical protein
MSWASGLGWGGGGLLLLLCALEYCGGGAAKTGPRSTRSSGKIRPLDFSREPTLDVHLV